MPDPAPIPEAYVRADALVRELTADPELGAAVRAKVKARFPEVGFVEDRIDPAMASMQSRLDDERVKREALEAKIAAREAKDDDAQRGAAFADELEKARAKYRLNDYGFNLAIERMKEKGQYDAEAAAAWAASLNPPVTEPAKSYLGPQNANYFKPDADNERLKLLHRDPSNAFIDAELNDFARDPDAYVREALGA